MIILQKSRLKLTLFIQWYPWWWRVGSNVYTIDAGELERHNRTSLTVNVHTRWEGGKKRKFFNCSTFINVFWKDFHSQCCFKGWKITKWMHVNWSSFWFMNYHWIAFSCPLHHLSLLACSLLPKVWPLWTTCSLPLGWQPERERNGVQGSYFPKSVVSPWPGCIL